LNRPVLRAFAALSVLSSLDGCGVADTVEPSGDASTVVHFSVRECPSFTNHLIFPGQLPLGEAAYVFAIAEEPKKADVVAPILAYSWQATSGSFSAPKQPYTDYHCAEAGDQVLTATAENPTGCRVRLSLPVTCLDE
jgi:hypothetical protein